MSVADLFKESEARRLAAHSRIVRLGWRADDPVERLVRILAHRRRIFPHHNAPACVQACHVAYNIRYVTHRVRSSQCTGLRDGRPGTVLGSKPRQGLPQRHKALPTHCNRVGLSLNPRSTEATIERRLVHDNCILNVVPRVRHHGNDRILQRSKLLPLMIQRASA
jgi:hypothetical protein